MVARWKFMHLTIDTSVEFLITLNIYQGLNTVDMYVKD